MIKWIKQRDSPENIISIEFLKVVSFDKKNFCLNQPPFYVDWQRYSQKAIYLVKIRPQSKGFYLMYTYRLS